MIYALERCMQMYMHSSLCVLCVRACKREPCMLTYVHMF